MNVLSFILVVLAAVLFLLTSLGVGKVKEVHLGWFGFFLLTLVYLLNSFPF